VNLIERLLAHADAHEYIAKNDPEQEQWMRDLRDAAREIERDTGVEVCSCCHKSLAERGCDDNGRRYK